MEQLPTPNVVAPPPCKPGPKPRPAVRAEELFGGKYVQALQKHLLRLRAAHPHPNRTLFFDSVAVAYLLAFFSPAIRSLRTLDDLSQTPEMQEQTGAKRIARSTLSDANKVFDPAFARPAGSGVERSRSSRTCAPASRIWTAVIRSWGN